MTPDPGRARQPGRPRSAHASLYLVGFHGSPAGERALAYAVGQAKRHAAELVIVVADVDLALWPHQERARRLHIITLRARVETLLKGTGLSWTIRLSSRAPVTALRDEAREQQADLIVVGAGRRRRLGLSRQVGGRLAAWAPAPVLVVH